MKNLKKFSNFNKISEDNESSNTGGSRFRHGGLAGGLSRVIKHSDSDPNRKVFAEKIDAEIKALQELHQNLITDKFEISETEWYFLEDTLNSLLIGDLCSRYEDLRRKNK